MSARNTTSTVQRCTWIDEHGCVAANPWIWCVATKLYLWIISNMSSSWPGGVECYSRRTAIGLTAVVGAGTVFVALPETGAGCEHSVPITVALVGGEFVAEPVADVGSQVAEAIGWRAASGSELTADDPFPMSVVRTAGAAWCPSRLGRSDPALCCGGLATTSPVVTTPARSDAIETSGTTSGVRAKPRQQSTAANMDSNNATDTPARPAARARA
jgi:hypothetical protein